MNFLSSNFSARLTCFAKSRTRPGVFTFEKDEPVTKQPLFIGLDEIDIAAISLEPCRCPRREPASRSSAMLDVPVLVGQEILEVLEGGDQFALAFLGRDVLDGMTDGEHGRRIHYMMEIAIRNRNEITQSNLGVRTTVMDAHCLGAFLEMVVIRLQLRLELLGRGVLAMRFG